MGLRLRPPVWSGLRGLRDPAQNTQGFVLVVPAVYQGDERELISVPEGPSESSQAIYCLVYVLKWEPSRRHGMIGSIGVARSGRLMNRGQRSDRALRDGFLNRPAPGNELPGYDHSVPPGQNRPLARI